MRPNTRKRRTTKTKLEQAGFARFSRPDGTFDFSGQDLSGKDFSKMDLSGSDFSGTILDKCRFVGTTLTECDFSGVKSAVEANFRYATLSRADLSLGIFRGANFHLAACDGANMELADLTDTDFGLADIRGARLNGAQITDEELHRANSDEHTVFRDGKKRGGRL